MKFNEMDIIRASKNFPNTGVRRGDIGTVMIAYGSPREGYEVEFVDENGYPRPTFAVQPEELELVRLDNQM